MCGFIYLLRRVNSFSFLNFSCSRSVHLAYNGIERNVIKEKITRKKKLIDRQLESLLTFHAADLFLYTLKTSENLWFSDEFWEYKKTSVA